MARLLGVDAGGTRSTALIAEEDGRVLARAEGAKANYQSVGLDAARGALADLVRRALSEARMHASELSSACFGVAGADRAKDFSAIEAILPIEIPEGRRILVNDCELILRAGTSRGVGIAIVSGTGTNALGRGHDGSFMRVGGLCSELGDFGSGPDLGMEALRLAMRGNDGRGEPTALYDRLCEALGLGTLEDAMDLLIADTLDFGRLAPVVFEAAHAGDAVARTLLERAGRDLATSGRILLERLFPEPSAVTVALGGSVLQRGKDPTLVHTIARELRAARADVRVGRLVGEPVEGAVLLARDHLEASNGALAGWARDVGVDEID